MHLPEQDFNRKDVGIRLLYSLLFFIAFEIVKIILQVAVIFQFIVMFITGTYNEPVRNFSNKAIAYGYHALRYLALCSNRKVFPFEDFPGEIEPPEKIVKM